MSKNWSDLDNTAKIMPSTTTRINTNIFRISAYLKENIDEDILEDALNATIEEYPMLLYTMKKGLFWFYLEKSDIKPHIEKEDTYPCAKFQNNLLFRVSYYKKRINLEIYHALCDGNGAMSIFKYLIMTYLEKKYDIKAHPKDETSLSEKDADSFKKYDKSKLKIETTHNQNAYKLKDLNEYDDLEIVESYFDVDKVKEVSKKYNATITEYLVAVLIDSIIKNANIKDLTKPIGITVPIDLRKKFPSKTSRNFFFTMCIQYKYKDGYTIKDIIDAIKPEFENNLTKESLQTMLNTNMTLQNLVFTKIVPLNLKELILRFSANLAKRHETMTLSNLGIVSMPKVYEKYIERMSVYSNCDNMTLTCLTFKKTISLNFSTHLYSKEIIRTMIETIKNDADSKVSVISNIRRER